MKPNPSSQKNSDSRPKSIEMDVSKPISFDKKLEKVRSKSFDSKLTLYKDRFRFDEKELLMIKKRLGKKIIERRKKKLLNLF